MSAFLVPPECINSIVTYLHRQNLRFQWLVEEVACDVAVPDQLQRLADSLFVLNCEAIRQRYGEGAITNDLADRDPFEFRIVTRDPIDVFKAVNCLIYQCSEGSVPEQKLYKVLDRIGAQIAEQVVRTLPEYDAAPWGD
jgi:hypothetical protein